MSSCPEQDFPIADSQAFLEALLKAPRPGSDRILAFYDHRAGSICRDAKLLYIPLDDHMCHRGDGLFESIAYRNNRIYALDAHLARLEDGAAFLSLEPPMPFTKIRELIIAVARASGSPSGDLRVFLGRGCGSFGISPGDCPASSLYVVALKAALPPPELYAEGLRAFTSAVPPKQAYLARIKNTNYLPNVLMALEASQKKRELAISFDSNGNLVEAAIANIAIVDKAGCLLCPPMDNILPGTTLLAALELAASRMEVKVRPVAQADLADCREMLMFTSASLCVAITHFDDRPINDGKPGPVALWLKDALATYMQEHGTPF